MAWVKLMGAGCLVGVLALSPTPRGLGQGADKVYKTLTTDRFEGILKEMNITFKKTPDQKNANTFFYDYDSNKRQLRISYNKGQSVYIDWYFKETISLEKINEWNRRAKFSRAVQLNNGQNVSLEWQMDLGGGASDNILKQFIRRFENETNEFDRFLGPSAPKS